MVSFWSSIFRTKCGKSATKKSELFVFVALDLMASFVFGCHFGGRSNHNFSPPPSASIDIVGNWGGGRKKGDNSRHKWNFSVTQFFPTPTERSNVINVLTNFSLAMQLNSLLRRLLLYHSVHRFLDFTGSSTTLLPKKSLLNCEIEAKINILVKG